MTKQIYRARRHAKTAAELLDAATRSDGKDTKYFNLYQAEAEALTAIALYFTEPFKTEIIEPKTRYTLPGLDEAAAKAFNLSVFGGYDTEMITCEKCGHQVMDGDAFCVEDGCECDCLPGDVITLDDSKENAESTNSEPENENNDDDATSKETLQVDTSSTVRDAGYQDGYTQGYQDGYKKALVSGDPQTVDTTKAGWLADEIATLHHFHIGTDDRGRYYAQCQGCDFRVNLDPGHYNLSSYSERQHAAYVALTGAYSKHIPMCGEAKAA